MTVDVLTFGEAMASFRSEAMLRMGGSVSLSIAGAESNLAIALARLGHSVRWVGRVGDDELGALVLRTLRAEGVDVGGVGVAPGGLTGVMLSDRAPGGAIRVHYRRRTSAARGLVPSDLDASLADGARALHVTGITPVLGEGPAAAVTHAVAAMRSTGATVCLDVNYRAALVTLAEAAALLRPLLPSVDVLIASEEELAVVSDGSDEQARIVNLLDTGVGEIVVKRGARGATVHTAAGSRSAAALDVRLVDPVGAGDAFGAGYLSGLLDGEPVAGRLARAVALGATAVSSAGDWEGLPTRAELVRLAPGEVLR